jgi:site-specific DNA recombinase
MAQRKCKHEDPVASVAVEKQVVGYVRLTREKSLKTDLSAPAQRRELAAYARQAGLTGLRVLEETEATPGDLPFQDRTAGKQLWQAIASGTVAHVIVRDLDRLVRSDNVWPAFRDLLRRNGVTLHTLTGPVPLDSPSDRFATTVRVAAYVLEREQTSERGRRAKREGARQGRHMGGPPPFGYTSQSRYFRELCETGASESDARIKSERRFPHRARLYKDPGEAKVVRIVFDLYVTKRSGCRTICNYLNGRGFRRRSGKLWCPDKVRRVLMDPAVAGFVAYDEVRFENRHAPATPKPDQQLHRGQHPALVNEGQWRQAQEVRKANRLVEGRGDASGFNRRYALSGVLQCTCGAKMRVASQQKKRGYAYYCCRRRRDYGPESLGGCGRPRVAVQKVEAAVWSCLAEVLATPSVVTAVHQAAWRSLQETSRRKRDDRQCTDELATVRKNLARWYERHDAAASQTESEAAWRRILELTALKEQLTSRLASPSDADADPPVVTEQAVREFLNGLTEHMQHADDRGAKVIHALVRDHQLEVRLDDAEHVSIRLAIRPFGNATESFKHAVPIDQRVRLAPGRIEAWLEENRGNHCCDICGTPIKVVRRHFWKGVPQVHRGCHIASLARTRNPDPRRYYTGGEAARCLGISRTHFGRWVKAGKVRIIKREKNVLLCSKKAIDALAKAR